MTAVQAIKKYSAKTGVVKAAKHTILQTIIIGAIAVLTFIVANPIVLGQLLGSWQNVTMIEMCALIGNFIINWLKNQGLGK